MKSLLKKIIAALSSKTNELRIRVMIFFLLHKNSIDKNSLSHSLSHKLHALVAPHHHHPHTKKNDAVSQQQQEEATSGGTHLLMSYNKAEGTDGSGPHFTENCYFMEEEKYPELTHALFKESEAALEEEEKATPEVEEVSGGAAVEVAEEDDIDQAADLFIQRFKRQIQLQKQNSLEREKDQQIRLLQSN